MSDDAEDEPVMDTGAASSAAPSSRGTNSRRRSATVRTPGGSRSTGTPGSASASPAVPIFRRQSSFDQQDAGPASATPPLGDTAGRMSPRIAIGPPSALDRFANTPSPRHASSSAEFTGTMGHASTTRSRSRTLMTPSSTGVSASPFGGSVGASAFNSSSASLPPAAGPSALGVGSGASVTSNRFVRKAKKKKAVAEVGDSEGNDAAADVADDGDDRRHLDRADAGRDATGAALDGSDGRSAYPPEDDEDYFDPDLPLESLMPKRTSSPQKKKKKKKKPGDGPSKSPSRRQMVGKPMGAHHPPGSGDIEGQEHDTEAAAASGDLEHAAATRDEEEEEEEEDLLDEQIVRVLVVKAKPTVVDPLQESNAQNLIRVPGQQLSQNQMQLDGVASHERTGETALGDGLVSSSGFTIGNRLQRPLFWYEMQYVAEGIVPADVTGRTQLVTKQWVSGVDRGQLDTDFDSYYTLLVDIRSVTITADPFLSRQAVLGAQLEALVAEYHSALASSQLQYLHETIAALRSRFAALASQRPQPDELRSSSSSVPMATAADQAKLVLLTDLARARTERDVEIGRTVAIVRRVLALWKELKAIQLHDGFVGSTIRVKFRRVPVSEVDLRRDQADLEDQVTEHVFLMHVSGDRTKELERKEIRTKLAADMYALRLRNPTDDFIVPVLHSVSVTPVAACPPAEQDRRRRLSSRAVMVQVFVNGVLACTTKPNKRCDDRGRCDLGELFVLKVHSHPRSLAVQVNDCPRVFIGIPFDSTSVAFSTGTISIRTAWEDETRVPVVKGGEIVPAVMARALVGASDPNDPRNNFGTHAASTNRATGLSAAEDGAAAVASTFAIAPPASLIQPMSLQEENYNAHVLKLLHRSAGGSSAGELDALALHGQYLDGDPIAAGGDSNANFLKRIRQSANLLLGIVGSAGPHHQQKSTTAIRITDVVREPVFPSIRSIFHAIGDFFEIRRRLRPKRKKRDTPVSRPAMCRVLVQIGRGVGFPTRRGVVDGSGGSGMGGVASSAGGSSSLGPGAGFDDGYGGGSSSGPHRSAGRRAGLLQEQQQQQQQQQLMQHGRGKAEDEEEIEEEPVSAATLHPFVEVTFQSRRARTATGTGTRPLFNEGLTINFIPPQGDFSPENLRAVRDEININVFDEVTSELVKDARDTNLFYERRDRRWIGSLKIPFATVYTNRVVEGTFRLDVPPINVGYQSEADLVEDPKLHVFLTLDPPLELFEPEEEEPPSVEDARLQGHAKRWLEFLAGKHSKREYRCLANDSRGRSVLLCRYIRPQAPPKEVRDSIARTVRFVSCIPFIEDAAAFATRADVWSTSSQFLKLRGGDWEEHAILLCNYFLFMKKKKAYVVLGHGIPEGDTAYVLTVDELPTGTSNVSISGGNSASSSHLVGGPGAGGGSGSDGGGSIAGHGAGIQESRHGSHTYLLWNAATGDSFDISDQFCPLRRIFVVFNAENIWANVQSVDFPKSMSFNFDNPKEWHPFFSARTLMRPDVLDSVQTFELVYEPTPVLFKDELEAELQALLMRCIERWRGAQGLTKWHRHANKKLSSLLEMFERDRQGIPFSEQEHAAQLASLRTAYDMHGFPIWIPWTDKNAVVDAVHNTDIHSTGDKDVEFAVGVHVVVFPHRIAAVWVYLATLASKR